MRPGSSSSPCIFLLKAWTARGSPERDWCTGCCTSNWDALDSTPCGWWYTMTGQQPPQERHKRARHAPLSPSSWLCHLCRHLPQAVGAMRILARGVDARPVSNGGLDGHKCGGRDVTLCEQHLGWGGELSKRILGTSALAQARQQAPHCAWLMLPAPDRPHACSGTASGPACGIWGEGHPPVSVSPEPESRRSAVGRHARTSNTSSSSGAGCTHVVDLCTSGERGQAASSHLSARAAAGWSMLRRLCRAGSRSCVCSNSARCLGRSLPSRGSVQLKRWWTGAQQGAAAAACAQGVAHPDWPWLASASGLRENLHQRMQGGEAQVHSHCPLPSCTFSGAEKVS